MPEEIDAKTPVPATPVPSMPVNPEAAAVKANAPAVKPGEALSGGKKLKVAPKKIGKEGKGGAKMKFLVGCAGAFVLLFVIFIVLMVFMISKSGASNPVMQAFGLDPGGIRNFLQGVVGFSLGILSLLFLIIAVIGLFKYLGAQKSDKEKRSHNLRVTLFNTIALVFVVFIWVILAAFIGNIEISAERVIAEIVVLEPQDLSALSAPVEIRFSAENVAIALQQAGAKITIMNWDLDGDGIYETPVQSPEITHLYNQRGTYVVGLEVKLAGDEPVTEIYTQDIVIGDAVFEANPSTGTAPQIVEFDASTIVSKDNIRSLDWDFDGDKIFDLEGPDNMKPSYIFEQIGDYKVQLRVIDKSNNVENYYRTIQITQADKPILSAQIDETPGLVGGVPFQVRFDGEDSKSLKGTITQYQWDFDDGTELQSGKTVSHVFSDPGYYNVTLTITDSLGNQAESTVEVEATSVSSVPEAVITSKPAAELDSPLTGTLPFKVAFDAGNSLDADKDIVVYEWDFNDDGTLDQEGKNAEYTFDKAGTFTVKLTVKDSEDQSGNATMQVIVEEPGVQATITATPGEGTAPLIVQFDGSSSSAYQGNIVSYEWDFGDGSPKTITGAIVSHKYNNVGNYTVKLKVLTNNNESASNTHIIYVREIPLKACFIPSRFSGLAPLTVTFDAKCSTGAVDKYHWLFGNGDESIARGPTYTFEFPGAYTVILEVTDAKSNVSQHQEIIVVEGNLE